MSSDNKHLQLATLTVMQAVIKRVHWDIAIGKEDADTIEGIEALAEAARNLLKDIRRNHPTPSDHA